MKLSIKMKLFDKIIFKNIDSGKKLEILTPFKRING